MLSWPNLRLTLGFELPDAWRADASCIELCRLSAVLTASQVLRSPRITSYGDEVVFRTSSRATGPQINAALTYGLGASAK